MAIDFVLVFVTAAITSALTIAAAWFLYQRYAKQMLVDWIDKKADELGEQVTVRVREGVQQGIKGGVSDVGSEVVKRATEIPKKTGFGMIEESMNVWFRSGRKPPGRKEDDDGEDA